MTVTIETAPAELPITVAEAKQHLYVGSDTDADRDAVIERCISLAVREFEHRTNRRIITQSLLQTFDQFPPERDFVNLNCFPFQSLVSVKYWDEDDTLQTFSTDNYGIVSTGYIPRIYLKTGKTWPSDIHPTKPAAVEIRTTAGYASAAADLPAECEEIKAILLLVIGDLFKYREDQIDAPGIAVAKVFDVRKRFIEIYRVNYFDYRDQSRTHST